ERQLEWGLADDAAEAVRTFIAQGLVPQTRDRVGNLILRFPRLAVDWPYFEHDDNRRQSTAGSTWSYRGERGQALGLSSREVAERMAKNPEGAHSVWTKGMDNWKEARAVPEIARLLATLGGPLPSPAQPLETAPPEDDVPPPLPGAEDPGPLFHYACDT